MNVIEELFLSNYKLALDLFVSLIKKGLFGGILRVKFFALKRKVPIIVKRLKDGTVFVRPNTVIFSLV